MHETFHNVDLDFSKYDHGFSDKHIHIFFPSKKPIKFYESYCEVWALLFHSIFYSMQHNKSLNFILNRELDFSLFQCSKILDHFDMRYIHFFTNTHKAIISRENYKENTPVISYYFFKTIFLYHINDFLEWCYKENDRSIRFSKLPSHYVDIYQKIKNLVMFLEEHYKTTPFLKAIKEKEKQFQKEKKVADINSVFYFKTLRMTYYDLTNN